VKKNNFINSLFAALLLASPLAMADQKYPAADFQPEVVYQDKDYITQNTGSVESNVASQSSEGADSKYPAANFQPQVLYTDTNYKHSESPVSSASVEQKTSAVEVSNEENGVAVKKEESKLNYLIMLAVAAAGFFLYKKQCACAKKSESKVATVQTTAHGLTGVARYLNKKSGTGVSRYLEKQVKSATSATGVARYMAKQVSTAKTTATQAATGVEKYMRNRG